MSINTFVELVRRNQKPGMIVAEIGCHDGTTAQNWMPIVEDNAGWGIVLDYFHGNPTVAAGNGHGQISYNTELTMSILYERLRKFERFVMIRGASNHAAKLIANGSLDICFIDADHRFSGLYQDILAWTPKLKSGGILCGHDCDTLDYSEAFTEQDTQDGKHHGVAKALRTLFPNIRVLGDTVWVADSPWPA